MAIDGSRVRARRQPRLLLAWLWPSLALGAATMLAVLSTGVDYAYSWQIPFALGEFVILGLPVGVVFGALVYGLVVLVWAVSRHRLSAGGQPIAYGVVAFAFSTASLFGFLSLFPLAFSTILFSLVVGVMFGCAFFVQCRRSLSQMSGLGSRDQAAPGAGAEPKS